MPRPLVTCRQCGRQGYEDDDDVCPGLCPVCLQAHLDASLRTAAQAVEAGVPILEVIDRSARAHLAAGLTPAWVAGFVQSQRDFVQVLETTGRVS